MGVVITKDGVKHGILRCKICRKQFEGIEDFDWHFIMVEHGELAICRNPRDFVEFEVEENETRRV